MIAISGNSSASSLGRRLGEIELAPLLGRAVAILTANGFHEDLFDRTLEFGHRFLERREDQLCAAAEAQRHRWWIPKSINRQIAKAIIAGIKGLLCDLREHGSPARRNLFETVEKLIRDLDTSPEFRARMEQAKMRLLQDPEVTAWLASAWHGSKESLLADLESPASKLRQGLTMAIASLGDHLMVDTAMRSRLSRTVEAMATEVVPWRSGLAQLITEVVQQWDPKKFTERIETAVGADLQCVRITGTLVGGIIGCALYLISSALQ